MGSDYNSQWRLSLALGSVPMIFAFYFRWIMHETSWKDEVPMVGLKYILINDLLSYYKVEYIDDVYMKLYI